MSALWCWQAIHYWDTMPSAHPSMPCSHDTSCKKNPKKSMVFLIGFSFEKRCKRKVHFKVWVSMYDNQPTIYYLPLHLLMQPWICAQGTHWGFVARHKMELRSFPTLQHLTSSRTWKPDHFILRPIPYSPSYMLSVWCIKKVKRNRNNYTPCSINNATKFSGQINPEILILFSCNFYSMLDTYSTVHMQIVMNVGQPTDV